MLWLVAALACLVAFALLGVVVARRPPLGLDRASVALRGKGTPLAAIFTALGRWWAVVAVTLLAATLAAATRRNVAPVFWLFGSQAASQGVVNLAKRLFRRTRPESWLLYHEPDLSYPSGHATTAVVFFAELLVLAQALPDPHGVPALALDVALAACVVGIPWSRLALGAHFATDVLGGLLLGCSWSCATLGLATSTLHLVRL